MSNEPLTLQQAKAICEGYKDLKGTMRLNEKGDFEVIVDVVLAPYAKLNKLLFFTFYKEMKCPVQALGFYNQIEYDVVVILREIIPVGEGYISHMDIRSYLGKSLESLSNSKF